MPPQSVAIIAHAEKSGAAELVLVLLAEFGRAGVKVELDEAAARLAKVGSGRSIEELATKTDLLVVLGGDGTILTTVRGMKDQIKPVFGINIGSLGFLTCVNSSAYEQAVSAIVKGEFSCSNRVLLSVAIGRDDEWTEQPAGLNDAVLSRGEISRLIRLQTRVNNEPLTEFNADGLVIATPTGSTAYSLSAGGPILAPESGVFVITPICPHVLTNRSVIIDDNSIIEVGASEPDYPVYLTIDGREPVCLEFGTRVRIRKAAKKLPLAVLPDVSFFSVVRQKLKWSGSTT
jgi:NAD+ kinase